MSVYIKGMKMPSCCADGCDFLEPMGLKCLRTHKFLDREDYRYERPEDCPLVEVPEPHGDLIDRDALKKTGRYEIYFFKGRTAKVCFVTDKYLDEFTAVIPREDGETDGQD